MQAIREQDVMLDAGPMNMLLDQVDWQEVEHPAVPDAEGLPYMTHTGVMHLQEARLRVYRLSTGQRVIDQDDLLAFLFGKTTVHDLGEMMARNSKGQR